MRDFDRISIVFAEVILTTRDTREVVGKIYNWLKDSGGWLLLGATAVALLIGVGLGKLSLSAALTSFASVVVALFTVTLANLAREANIFTFWSQKHLMNPDLRVHVKGRWMASDHMRADGLDDNGAVVRTSYTARWSAELLLWNTGTGTILVTGWDVDDETGRMNLHVKERGGPSQMSPPVLVPSQGGVWLDVQITCEGNPNLRFSYSTADEESRSLCITVGAR